MSETPALVVDVSLARSMVEPLYRDLTLPTGENVMQHADGIASILRVTHSSGIPGICSVGKYFVIGSSKLSFPSVARIAQQSAVIDLLIEAIPKIVCVSAGS